MHNPPEGSTPPLSMAAAMPEELPHVEKQMAMSDSGPPPEHQMLHAAGAPLSGPELAQAQ